MLKKKVDANRERMFLMAMATRKAFLAGVSGHVDPAVFEAKYVRQTATWCLDYFKKFNRAPKRGELEALYHEWDAANTSTSDSDALRDFLEGLSDEDERKKRPNLPFLFQTFSKYMTLRKASMLKDQLTNCILRGDDKEALNSITSFRASDIGSSVGFDVFNDRAAWEQAFAESPKPIIDFPGDGRKFFRDTLVRGGLVAIHGPEKRGKSHWCVEFAFRALRSGCKVAMFQAGDLSKTDIMRRIVGRVERTPFRKWECKPTLMPTKIVVTKQGNALPVADVTGTFLNDLKPAKLDSAWGARERLMDVFKMPTDSPTFMMDTEFNSTLTVANIDSILQRWEQELDFSPDVVLIDYADILAPENPRVDLIQQYSERWKRLRRLSLERNCLVISPTQANSAGYKAQAQRMEHFSGSKSKNAEVTAMMGLNQTPEEKKRGIMKLNWMAKREGFYDPNSFLWVAQCLSLNRAYCCSHWPKWNDEDSADNVGGE